MTKIRKNRKGDQGKKDSPWWQWLLLVVIALVLFYAINLYLDSREKSTDSKNPSKTSNLETQDTPELLNEEAEWSLSKAELFLPDTADPDHFEVHPLLPTKDALLSFGTLLPGKEPDSKGLTNTSPGLSLIHWDGSEYKSQNIPLDDLELALDKDLLNRLRGQAQVGTPLEKSDFFLIPIRFFLNKDEQEIMAYVWVKEGQAKWATLVKADGTEIPAAFWIGTTETKSHQIRHRKRDTQYLIMENGNLDEAKPYEGFQWEIQAYRWEGGNFRYDEAYSKELTKKKQNEG